MSNLFENQHSPDSGQPRSARHLVAASFALYRRYPLLFLVLAAGVIVPYELLTLLATGTGSSLAPTPGSGPPSSSRCWTCFWSAR